MIHTFKCLNRFFAVDVESGSFFEIDEIVNALLQGGDVSVFNAEKVSAAREEIKTLKAQGVLDSKASTPPELKYSPIVKAMCLNVSHNCNLACNYCFAAGGTYNDARRNMPFDVAKQAIDFLVAHSATRRNLEVDFFGGEPTLNLDVVKRTVGYARSLEAINNKKFRFTITTNAYSLTEQDVEFFNKEMYNVVISIDGRKEIHDRVRKNRGGEGSFDRVIKNALMFRRLRKGQYYVRGTFTAANLDFSKDVLYLNDLGFDQLSIEPVVLPEGDPMAIKQSDYEFVKGEYEKLAGEYIKRRKTDKWFNFFHFMLDLDSAPCESKRLKGCGAGCEYLAVAPSGDIYPCHQFDGKEAFKLGNVSDGALNDALRKEFFDVSVLTKPKCRECWAKYNCSGGCIANSYNCNGTISEPYEGACELMKKRLECSYAIKAIEGGND